MYDNILDTHVNSMTDLMYTVMNAACPVMEDYYGELALDFATIECSEFNKHAIAVRTTGTSYYADPYDIDEVDLRQRQDDRVPVMIVLVEQVEQEKWRVIVNKAV